MKWFKHFSKAHEDRAVETLINEFGVSGYGLYFYCLELIVGTIDAENVSFELEPDAPILARRLSMDTVQVEKIMHRCIELGLFEISDGGRLTCLKIGKYLEKSSTTNPEIRTIIAKTKAKGQEQSGLVRISQEDPDQIRLDKIRLEGEHTQEAPAPVPPNFLKTVYDAWMACPALPRLPDFLGFSISDQARRAMAAWQGNHSDDILAAVRNYGEIAAHPRDYWPKGRPGMAGFFEGEIFLKCLPANFPDSCYTDEKKQSIKWEAAKAEARRDAEEARG